MAITPSVTEPVVAIRNLTMCYGRHVVHEHIDLNVYQGEILAIVGACNGKVRSTPTP